MIMVNYLLVFSIFTEKIQHIYLSVSETIMFGPWEVKIISYLKKIKNTKKTVMLYVKGSKKRQIH
jgi:hypothetical protein